MTVSWATAAAVFGGVGEPAAGTDRRHLVLVPDEHHPPTGTGRGGDDLFEDADVGHPRFVDDEQRAPVDRFEAAVDVADAGRAGCGPGYRRRR